MTSAGVEKSSYQRRRHLSYCFDIGIGEKTLSGFIGDRSHDELCSDVRQISSFCTSADFAFELITLAGADHSKIDFAAELGDLDLPELIGTASA
jgi:hypothetical protein